MLAQRSFPPALARLWKALLTLLLLAVVLAIGNLLGHALLDEEIWTYVVTGVGVATVFMIVLVNPLHGFLFWLVLSPFSRFMYLDIDMGAGIPDLTLTRLVGGLLFAFLLAKIAAGRRKMTPWTRVDTLMILSAITLAISIPAYWRGPKAGLTLFADGFVVPFFVYFIAKNLVTDRRAFVLTIGGLLLTGTFLASAAIHEQVTGQVIFWYSERSFYYTRSLHRLAGVLGNPAFFGTVFAMIIPLLAWGMLEIKTRTRWLFAGGLALLTIGTYFTYNRASYLGLIIGLLILAAYYPRFRMPFVPAAVGAAFLTIVRWQQVISHPVVTERLDASKPVLYRLGVFSSVGQIVSKSPLFGRGFDNFWPIYETEVLHHLTIGYAPLQPHNTFLWVLVSGGIIALLPFAGLFISIVWQSGQLYRSAPPRSAERMAVVACWAAFGAYLTQLLVADIAYFFYPNIVFYTIIGAVFGYGLSGWKEELEPGV